MTTHYHKAQYKEVAGILSDKLDMAKKVYGQNPEYCAAYRSAILSLIDGFADLFAADNGLFDRSRFLRAANPNEIRR